jgi:hypothetical protein
MTLSSIIKEKTRCLHGNIVNFLFKKIFFYFLIENILK